MSRGKCHDGEMHRTGAGKQGWAGVHRGALRVRGAPVQGASEHGLERQREEGAQMTGQRQRDEGVGEGWGPRDQSMEAVAAGEAGEGLAAESPAGSQLRTSNC